MHRRIEAIFAGFLFIVLLGGGCQARETAEQALPTAVVEAPTITRAAPTGTAAAMPTSTAAPDSPAPTSAPPETPSSTPEPTATEARTLRLAVPSSWELEALAAAAMANTGEWEIVLTESGARLLGSGHVDAALLANDAGVDAGWRPVALAVPFISDWDSVNMAEALEIWVSGHELVTVTSWERLTPAQRALRVDGLHISDPVYPLRQAWSIHALPPAQASAERIAAALQEMAVSDGLHLAAVGDIMLNRSLGASIAAGDTGFPFAYVAQLLQDADYTIGNVESALGDVGEPAAKSYTFRAPPAAARSLAEAGFDLVSLANNHALDYGPEALFQGMALLAEAGIATVGAGADAQEAHDPHLIEVNGIRLGFLAYVDVPVEGRAPYFDTSTWTAGPDTPGLAWAEPALIVRDVGALRDVVDHVIVILHSGYEYVPSPSPEQAAAARSAIDAGATLVIGHHAHILQGVEFRESSAIVYGLGNFAFNITGPPQTVILHAWFDESGLRQLDFTPALIQGSGQPVPASSEDGAAIRRQIYGLSRSLN